MAMEVLKMTIYDRIKMLREMNGMSQEELARKVGYNGRSMISRIEAGKIDLQISKLEMIADALGVSVVYLFGTDEHQKNKDIALLISNLISKAADLDDVDLAKLEERADTMLESDKYKGADS